MNAISELAMKGLLRTVGQLSDGIRIACDSGLTSGRMLDYIYRNQPAGRGRLGRWVDRLYLSAPAWKAVRRRADLLTRTIHDVMEVQLAQLGDVLVLDIACGRGRYLLDVLPAMPSAGVRAICWDLDEQVLAEAHELARRRGVGNVTYATRDVMSSESYASLAEVPAVVIASGFYDWFDDPTEIRRSFALVRSAMDQESRFIFTVQTNQVGLGRTNQLFRGFDGRPLNMQAWPLPLIHGLARQEGLLVEDSPTTSDGCYAVTVAKKM